MTSTIENGPVEYYRYSLPNADHSHAYLLPVLKTCLALHVQKGARVLDIGAGNGYVGSQVAASGYDVEGIEPSPEGVAVAARHFPQARVRLGSAYDDFSSLGQSYDAVYALEVIEHLYSPRKLVSCARAVLKPGGLLIISTPYHGYIKNLLLALTGKLDGHFTALWEHGHIKFFSVKTLSELLSEQGFEILTVHRVGRLPIVAKSFVMTARTPL